MTAALSEALTWLLLFVLGLGAAVAIVRGQLENL